MKMTMFPIRPSMMRPVLAVLAILTLTAPFAVAAEPAAFSARQGCRVVGVPLDLPDCAVQHAGTATWVECAEGSCTFSLSITSSATALPAGVQSLSARVIGDTRVVVCSASQVSVQAGSISCAGEATITVVVPTGCRLLVIETVGEADRVIQGGASSELRICTNGSLVVL